jgi:hypothetical protein
MSVLPPKEGSYAPGVTGMSFEDDLNAMHGSWAASSVIWGTESAPLLPPKYVE